MPARSAIGAGRSCPGGTRQFRCAGCAAGGRAVFGVADDIGSTAFGNRLPDFSHPHLAVEGASLTDRTVIANSFSNDLGKAIGESSSSSNLLALVPARA